MSLASGTRLGPYEIQSAIGAGGMGEVYKARDTRLDRTVAIKVLPPDVSHDPERRARFEREAKAVAGLSHPHICPLFDVGDHDGAMFLVMEHLVGQTLAERLEKGALPLAQALTVATEIAGALSAAHRQGVIHRDLKPGNVMLTKGGGGSTSSPQAKLLDFGLAKLTGHGEQSAAGPMVSAAPTQSAALTGQGVIVGTLQYMSPEQLEGKPSDARTDVWALGAILYEMVTGTRAFEGTSAVSLMGAILERDPPPIASRQPLTPPGLDRLVRKCLQKNPELRWQSAADLADELRWIAQPEGDKGAGAIGTHWRLATLVLVALVGLGVGAAATWRFRAPLAARTSRLSVSVADEGLTLTLGGVAISPDGGTVVFTGRQGGDPPRLYVRRLDESRSRRLEGTDGAVAPMFSPDGASVAFTSEGWLKKIQLVGGKPETICKVSYQGPSRGSWAADGTILTSQWPGLPLRVPPGGTPQPLADLPAASYFWPHLLPDGKSLLVTRRTGGQSQVVGIQPDGKVRELFPSAASCARYVPTGHLLYEAAGRLRAVAFDPARLQPLGASREVIDDMAIGVVPGSGAAVDYDVSTGGDLVYLSASMPLKRLVWRDRTGRTYPIGFGARRYGFPSLSPDGRELAITVAEGMKQNIWVGRLGSQLLEPITSDGATTCCSVFSPDGRWLYYSSDAGGTSGLHLVRSRRDSDLPPEPLFDRPAFRKPTSLSRGGILLFNEATSQGGGRRIIEVDVNRANVSATFGNPSGQENEGMFSPDGKWVAYQSDDTGAWEIYVKPYPASGTRRHRVSIDGGMGPMWNPRGGELFFQTRTGLMSVAIEDGTPKSAPRQLFASEKSEDHRREFDVAPDGERFLFMEPAGPRTEIKVILNWFEELKAKVPRAR